MKKLLTLFCILATHLFSTSLSVGREGEPIKIGPHLWQEVSYQSGQKSFSGMIPGEPSSGISGGTIYSASEYEGSYYEINTSFNNQELHFQNAKEFLASLSEEARDLGTCSIIDPGQSGALYCVEFRRFDGQRIVRVFLVNHHEYSAIVEGEDLSLAPFFFDSLSFEQ